MQSIVLALMAMTPACGGGGARRKPPTAPLVPLLQRYPIDGVVDFAGLTAHTVTLPFTDGVGAFVKSTTLTWAMANDDVDLYVALTWTDATFDNSYDATGPLDYDGLLLLFDGDASGTYDTGEDNRALITATPIGSLYVDQHKSATGADLCGDGYGKLVRDVATQSYRAEMLFPLNADAQGEDATIGAMTPFNLILFDHVQPALPSGNVAYLFPSDTSSSAWQSVPFVASPPLQRPTLPTGLTGLIVFTSDHEESHNEIYTFDPATGVVTRVTSNTTFEDNVSLSHDRQWIAFHGAPTYTDFANYEIWKVRVDGTGLTQLTNNAILDGHPGWSMDDSRICYASFRDAGAASIVVMTANGVEIADLTTAPDDDNDPDYLPGGRIVFKTNRFHPSPQVKMATMNDDGSGVQQITFDARSPATSDHDAVGDTTFAIFERFMKGTDYSTDIEAFFTPWNIIEARLDATSERTVLANGWINWLPLYDPSGQYIAFLESRNFTEVRLMTRAGQELGRLVPNLTKMHYIDWK